MPSVDLQTKIGASDSFVYKIFLFFEIEDEDEVSILKQV